MCIKYFPWYWELFGLFYLIKKFYVEVSVSCFTIEETKANNLCLSSTEDVNCFFFPHYILGEFQPHHLESSQHLPSNYSYYPMQKLTLDPCILYFMNSYCMPGADTSTFQMWTHLILTTTKAGRSYYHFHFMDEAVEAQRGWATCLRPHS